MSIHTVVTLPLSILKLCERFHHPVTGKREEAVFANFAEIRLKVHLFIFPMIRKYFLLKNDLFITIPSPQNTEPFCFYDVFYLKGTLPESLFSLLT